MVIRRFQKIHVKRSIRTEVRDDNAARKKSEETQELAADGG